jgi:hypothetical protein
VLVLAGDSSWLQPVLVLLLSIWYAKFVYGRIDRIIFAPPSSWWVHSDALQGLLEAFSEEMVSSGHACSTFVGEQTHVPPFVKTQRAKPPMNMRLTALVKHVSELHVAELKTCHCIEEFHHRRIRPLRHRMRCAYKCSWMADPNRESIDGKLPTLSLEYWGLSWSDIFPHFVQFCLKKKSTGTWPDCSIRTCQPRGRLTYRCPRIVAPDVTLAR